MVGNAMQFHFDKAFTIELAADNGRRIFIDRVSDNEAQVDAIKKWTEMVPIPRLCRTNRRQKHSFHMINGYLRTIIM